MAEDRRNGGNQQQSAFQSQLPADKNCEQALQGIGEKYRGAGFPGYFPEYVGSARLAAADLEYVDAVHPAGDVCDRQRAESVSGDGRDGHVGDCGGLGHHSAEYNIGPLRDIIWN